MTAQDALVKALDSAHWELGESFKGLGDDDVWRRVDPKLLSIGELAAHMAYGEINNLGQGAIESPLFNKSMRYYFYAVEDPYTADFGAAALYDEVQRVHGLAKQAFLNLGLGLEAVNPARPDWTVAQTWEYMAFHVAYHTGQIYSVRHLMGHETEDN
jgi:hypothetical protein